MKRLIYFILIIVWGHDLFAQADLEIVPATLTVSPASANIGTTISISFQAQNTGDVSANKSSTSIYLSPTTSSLAGALLSKISVESLPAGAVSDLIQYKFPITYNFGTTGIFNVIVVLNENNAITEGNYGNNSSYTSFEINSTPVPAQNIPYPVIYVHGLFSDNTTWDPLIDSLKNFYGWTYGGNMNFCLNYDATTNTSDTSSGINKDYHDFTDISMLVSGDYYTINFDINYNGISHLKSQSAQSAIVKQGLAIRDAINHVLTVTGKNKVILVGHSMGGLACRQYLQNSTLWQDGGTNHRVAKLVTVGTPHGGSNQFDPDVWGDAFPDPSSEAVRDLRTSHLFGYPGVFLFGGVEDHDYMRDYIICCDYYNVDVNCNGMEGELITGLNQKTMNTDLSFSCITGIGDPLSAGGDGDGAVTTHSANINNYLPVNARVFTLPKLSGVTSLWHTELTKQFAGIMQAMDEPNDNNNNHAYTVSSGNLYYGNITYQSIDSPPRDYDHYKINIPSGGNLTIQVYSIPTPVFSIDVFNSSGSSVYTFTSQGKSYLNGNLSVLSGNYYIVLSGIPTQKSYNYPYAFQFTFSPAQVYCSGTANLTAIEGTFTEGSGSSDYGNNSDCKWKIQPSGATSITLDFTAFDVDNAGDTVFVYDGSTTASSLLASYTGNSIPANVTSTGGVMLVRFVSDAGNTASGFTAHYSATTVTAYCNGAQSLTSASGSFSDGSGTEYYGDNANCSWLITPSGAFSITLNFTSFSTEPIYDMINVYDGSDNNATLLGSFSGSTIPSTITASGGALFVEFISNDTITSSGWNASYTSYIPVSNSGITGYSYWFDDNYSSHVSVPVGLQEAFHFNRDFRE